MALLCLHAFWMRLRLLTLSNIEKLSDRVLPNLVVRFLYRWYSTQELKIRWENVHSNKCCVSNGVSQGGVLSPIPFSINLDSLLVTLKHADIGCSWGGEFSGALAYADDVVLLSLSASGLRLMLRVVKILLAPTVYCLTLSRHSLYYFIITPI